MANATLVRSSFAGGQWSQLAQGRYHDPRYRTAMATCVNGLPLETEGWVRRPGFSLAIPTRSGAAGRVIRFDFEDETPPYTMVFTDGYVSFLSGLTPVTANDSVGVTSIASGIVTFAATVSWSTGMRGYFSNIPGNPLIENRIFTLTILSGTTASLTDNLTGATFSGSGTVAVGTLFNRILDLPTPYVGSSVWGMLRSVQTENTAFLLQGGVPPQALLVVTEPTSSAFATFNLAPAIFNDGPYLDPPTNGAQFTPNQKTGVVQLTLNFPAWISTTAYAIGDIVTHSSTNYVSLVDQNVGNTPGASPSDWATTNGNVAINNGQGFLSTDIGRLIRLFSQPQAWNPLSTYSTNAVVSYNPNNLPGQTEYWSSLTSSNTGNAPGTDVDNWEVLNQGGTSSPAIWTWGRIVSFLTLIPGNPSGIMRVGDMSGGGGLNAAFNGQTGQAAASSAQITGTGPGSSLVTFGWVGQNYSGCSPSSNKIGSVTVWPSDDQGFVTWSVLTKELVAVVSFDITAKLYASNSPPSGPFDGTFLGLASEDATILVGPPPGIFGPTPLTIQSSDQVTSYAYVWVVMIATFQETDGFNSILQITQTINVAQVEMVSPAGAAASANGIGVELLGAPLLYTEPIPVWRLGLYSNTTGWPTCGTWTDGRLWLSGVVPNRIDACVSNGVTITGNIVEVNFAPTDQYDNELDSSGISVTMNLPEANPFLWLVPDLQGIVCGTKAREALLFAPSTGGFSPTNVDARKLTRIGSANIEPVQCEHTFVIVQRYLRKIVEYFADVFSGKFTAPNLIQDSKNLSVGDIDELAYQQELAPIVWARVNGGLIGCTYKRDTLMTSSGPTMNGWHEHELGIPNSTIMSICAGGSVNGNLDALTVVASFGGFNYAMILGDILDEGSTQAEASYLDAGITPTSTSQVPVGVGFPYGGLQLNGLWQLNGKTVTAWLGGLDCGDYVVTNGSIQVPYGDGVPHGQGAFPTGNLSVPVMHPILDLYLINPLANVISFGPLPITFTSVTGAVNRNDQGLFTATFVASGITANGITMFTGAMPMRIGFTYTSQGQITRTFLPQEAGTQNGPAFGKLSRDHYLMLQVEGAGGVTGGVSCGQAFDSTLRPVLFRDATDVTYLTVDQQFTGIFRDQFISDYGFDTMPCWQVSRPQILNVTAFGAARETADV